MNVMLSLGSYQFSINTAAYQELMRSTSYRWPSQERFGQHAARQFTGPGEDSMTLTGVVYPEWRGGVGQLNELRTLASSGEPLLLVSGTGDVLGRWVIEKIDERQSIFSGEGVARRQGFTMNIQFFDAGEQAGFLDGLNILGDLLGFNPSSENALDVAKTKTDGLMSSVSSAASSALSSLNTALDSLKKVATTANAVVRPTMNAVNNGIRMANTVRESARILKGNLKNIHDLQSLGTQLDSMSRSLAQASNAGTKASKAAMDLLGTISKTADPDTWNSVSTSVTAAGSLATGMGRVFNSVTQMARSLQ